MFDEKSRYAGVATYHVQDRRGRIVAVVSTPPAAEETPLGVHLMGQGQRLDHLAKKYLDNEAGFWRICDLNDAMLPESLTEADEITIPRKTP